MDIKGIRCICLREVGNAWDVGRMVAKSTQVLGFQIPVADFLSFEAVDFLEEVCGLSSLISFYLVTRGLVE